MKVRNNYIQKIIIALLCILPILFIIVLSSRRSYSLTEAESDFIGELCSQGYTYHQAYDELFESKGKPCPFGTGGIDGINKYGTWSDPTPNTPAGGSSAKTPSHTHSWSEPNIIEEASCVKEGVAEYTCSCGKTKKETIPLKEHTYETKKEVPSSCKSYRSVTFICSVCGDEYTHEFEEEGYGEHIYIPMDDSILPTCTEEGLTHFVCNVCNDSYEEKVPELGHLFEEYTVDLEPSCTKEGSKSIHCSRTECNEIKEGSAVSIAAKGHREDANHEVMAPTFFKEGKETIRCIECNEVLQEIIIAPTGGIFRFLLPIGGALILVLIIVLLVLNRKGNK